MATPIAPINVPTVGYNMESAIKAVLRDTGSEDYALNVQLDAGALSIGSAKLEDGATTAKATINAANTARTTATTTLVSQLIGSNAIVHNNFTAGSAAGTIGPQVLVSDGTNARTLRADTTGRPIVVGAAADGAAVAGNPVLIGGSDGTNAQSLLVDTTGRPVIQGHQGVAQVFTDFAALAVGGVGTDSNFYPFVTDTVGRLEVIVRGNVVDGAAPTVPPVLIAGQDGTNTQSLKTDTDGELQVDVLTMPSIAIDEFPAAAAITDDFANPTTTSVMGMTMVWDGATWDRAPGDATNGLLVNLGANNDVVVTATNLDVRDLTNASDSVTIYGSDDGGTTKRVIKTDATGAIQVDSEAVNADSTVFESAARTATSSSSDTVNANYRGLHLVIDCTAIVDSPSVVFTIEGKDVVSGKYYTILASPAIVGAGTTALKVYPGITAAANASVSDILPRTWRVTATHADADSITYSVGASLIV